ncbi:MAG: hypothetical protein NTV68_15235, partial [Methanomicrobiales archaeon]|nr:hypothetical protein [Methanomicrobiales archaeon]
VSGDISDAVGLGLSESTVSGKDKIYVLEVNNEAIDSSPNIGERGRLANEMGNVHEVVLKTKKKEAGGKIEETLKDMKTKTGEPRQRRISSGCRMMLIWKQNRMHVSGWQNCTRNISPLPRIQNKTQHISRGGSLKPFIISGIFHQIKKNIQDKV